MRSRSDIELEPPAGDHDLAVDTHLSAAGPERRIELRK